MVLLDRVLSLGHSDSLPDWLARRVRITNALALLGLVLSLTGVPLDVLGAPPSAVIVDAIAVGMFACVWLLNAKGYPNHARILLMIAANGVVLGGVVHFGGVAELRTVLFPFAVMPFFVFGITERVRLAVFAALPITGYFLTAHIAPKVEGIAMDVNVVYAPALAFTMLIAGSAVFAWIQHTADEKLQRTQAGMAQSARLAALGEMASSIAHEIRNPLAAIHIAATQIVDHPNDPDQVKQFGQRIERIVMRASAIIEGLRSFSRDAGGDPFVKTPVQRIITDTLELCAKRFAESGTTLTVDEIPADLAVECRPVQVSQVLMNLLGNAYDAVSTSSDRSVRIEVRDQGANIEIAVSDGGPGIPEAVRDRIFEPFFTTKSVNRGTGLGLSLSRGIVESHRGTLELDTTSPRTRFVVRLPRVQAA